MGLSKSQWRELVLAPSFPVSGTKPSRIPDVVRIEDGAKRVLFCMIAVAGLLNRRT